MHVKPLTIQEDKTSTWWASRKTSTLSHKKERQKMLYFVYELINPETGVAGYVGITTNPNNRIQQHNAGLDSRNKPKKDWIDDMRSRGQEPQMRILETLDNPENARERERYWVSQYISSGFTLTNHQLNPNRYQSCGHIDFLDKLENEWNATKEKKEYPDINELEEEIECFVIAQANECGDDIKRILIYGWARLQLFKHRIAQTENSGYVGAPIL